jgi:hypothetical protein
MEEKLMIGTEKTAMRAMTSIKRRRHGAELEICVMESVLGSDI